MWTWTHNCKYSYWLFKLPRMRTLRRVLSLLVPETVGLTWRMLKVAEEARVNRSKWLCMFILRLQNFPAVVVGEGGVEGLERLIDIIIIGFSATIIQQKQRRRQDQGRLQTRRSSSVTNYEDESHNEIGESDDISVTLKGVKKKKNRLEAPSIRLIRRQTVYKGDLARHQCGFLLL